MISTELGWGKVEASISSTSFFEESNVVSLGLKVTGILLVFMAVTPREAMIWLGPG